MSKSSRRSSLGSEASFVSGDDGQQDGNNSECQASQHSNSREENNHPAIPVTKSHAAFVSKLYNMVEDSEIQHLISWSGNGELFRVYNPTTFSRNVLPQYFKHNNWQSFVRQLNMYGFNKVNDMIHSNLKNENQTWEFRHPHFRQGCIDDLRNIKRKSVRSLRATAPLPPSSAMDQDNKADMYHREYNMIEDRLNYITRGHNAMQEEFSSLRFVVARQQEIIEELVSLLENVNRPLSTPDPQSSSFTPNPMMSSKYADLRKKIAAIQTQLQTLYDHPQQSHMLPMMDSIQQQQQHPPPPPPPTSSTTSVSPDGRDSYPTLKMVAMNNEPVDPSPNSASLRIPSVGSTPNPITMVSPPMQRNSGSCPPNSMEPSLEGRSKSAIMGLGKESYLLNPADDELDPDTKRRRSSPP
ncbi:hypothetical protein O0I10_003212 [Lichtheimia ornata]|uniref:HSF-type DNA-binding domain-containing protein n=1 Tax=Lichtheimia ornata TaxID=688661 RepID=A0AAD7V9W4_9FUNG|nr:uncharacterized protein O0I10_003212 [Lichtheimia ornata]KAJ8660990.1 hypothetical protein O0I10_003212 [Lichtheimia ornata]